jgi:hypothetical protein
MMTSRRAVLGGIVALLAVVVAVWLHPHSKPRSTGPLPHQAYVWQRSWGPEVREATSRASGSLSGVVVLCAEVTWRDGHPRLESSEWEPKLLASVRTPVGLALRIGPYSGPFGMDDESAVWLAELAGSLIYRADLAGLRPAELQIDFDCAESKLEGYALWVQAIRHRIAPTPLVITALPSWLKHDSFRRLAQAADGFVLQVHSLDPPRGPGAPMTLCDPAAARRAVEQAAVLGRPFRVALPTYGYVVAFDPAGKFLGLSAEGPASKWPADTRLAELRADPAAMAELTQAWTADRPMNLQGIIWYRLPTDKDALNWSWPTFVSVIAGQTPRPALRSEVRQVEERLVKIELVNDGQADALLPSRLRIDHRNARLIAGDALSGFRWKGSTGGVAVVEAPDARLPGRLPAGERRSVAWLRLSEPSEVRVEMDATRD